MITLELENAKEVEQAIRSLRRACPQAVQRGVLKAAFDIQNHATKNAPIDVGNLRASSYVIWKTGGNPPKPAKEGKPSFNKTEFDQLAQEAFHEAKKIRDFHPGAGDISVVIGFGAFYALFVHEGDPSWNWNDGGPKFLEKALKDRGHMVTRYVYDEVLKVLRRHE